MEITDDIKGLMQDILSSYESRISTVGIIIDNTHRVLEDLKSKVNAMIDQLKKNLANKESLRKKDFDSMMKNIIAHQKDREEGIRNLLKVFFEEQKKVAEAIKKNLAESEKLRIDDFKKMLQDIQAKQRGRTEEVIISLKGFLREYREIIDSMHSLLDMGESIRIKDFKMMLRNINLKKIGQSPRIYLEGEIYPVRRWDEVLWEGGGTIEENYGLIK